jgi:hypothetical protein
MPTMLPALIRSALRSPNDALSVLLFRTEDAFDARLCRHFEKVYAYGVAGEQPWDASSVTPPGNLVILNGEQGRGQLPPDALVDVVVCPLREPHLAEARWASAQLHAPLVTLLTEVPPPGLSKGRLALASGKRGHLSVAPSKEVAAAWGFPDDEISVVKNWNTAGLVAAVKMAARQLYELKWGFA